MANDFGSAINKCFEYTSYQEDVTEPAPPPTFAEVPTARPSSRPSEVVAVGEDAAFA